jgi:hypothetical protein
LLAIRIGLDIMESSELIGPESRCSAPAEHGEPELEMVLGKRNSVKNMLLIKQGGRCG